MLSALICDAHARPDQQPVGTVHTIIIGPSYTTQGQPTLPEAATTCTALSELMASAPGTTALCGEAATREAIMASLRDSVDAMDEIDTLLIISLGAGWTSNEGEAFLLPADYSPYDLVASSLSVERDVLSWLRLLENRGQVVILADNVHADSIYWSEYEDDQEINLGVYTIGPAAASFADDTATNIFALSATSGEYTVDNELLGSLVISAFIGSADHDHDGTLTYGELESQLLLQTANVTGGRQELGSYGNWTAMRDVPLMKLPREPRKSISTASLTKPTRYGGLGLAAAGCATMVASRLIATSAYNDLEAGAYTDRDEYNDLVGRYDRAAGFYAPGMGVCATGLVLTGASFTLGSKDSAPVTVTPTATGLTIRW